MYKATEIDTWVAEIMQQYGAEGSTTFVGVATEKRPYLSETMDRGQDLVVDYDNVNKVATLQLCIDKKCLIIQLFYLDYMPQSLKDLFRSRNLKFIGDNIIQETSELMRDQDMEWNQNVTDCEGSERRRNEVSWIGFHSLYCVFRCHVFPERPDTVHLRRCDWQARVLNEDQLQLACLDAYTAYNAGGR
ncbi:hypothetical protein RND81_09G243900 [Saponaria officinalis]|uniref:3'-5' exonuclease domain-containing protein n=1 Tax=Saponaria officinalis TaxID=3572 RepID=A0AAW1ISE9_SAPOF